MLVESLLGGAIFRARAYPSCRALAEFWPATESEAVVASVPVTPSEIAFYSGEEGILKAALRLTAVAGLLASLVVGMVGPTAALAAPKAPNVPTPTIGRVFLPRVQVRVAGVGGGESSRIWIQNMQPPGSDTDNGAWALFFNTPRFSLDNGTFQVTGDEQCTTIVSNVPPGASFLVVPFFDAACVASLPVLDADGVWQGSALVAPCPNILLDPDVNLTECLVNDPTYENPLYYGVALEEDQTRVYDRISVSGSTATIFPVAGPRGSYIGAQAYTGISDLDLQSGRGPTEASHTLWAPVMFFNNWNGWDAEIAVKNAANISSGINQCNIEAYDFYTGAPLGNVGNFHLSPLGDAGDSVRFIGTHWPATVNGGAPTVASLRISCNTFFAGVVTQYKRANGIALSYTLAAEDHAGGVDGSSDWLATPIAFQNFFGWNSGVGICNTGSDTDAAHVQFLDPSGGFINQYNLTLHAHACGTVVLSGNAPGSQNIGWIRVSSDNNQIVGISNQYKFASGAGTGSGAAMGMSTTLLRAGNFGAGLDMAAPGQQIALPAFGRGLPRGWGWGMALANPSSSDPVNYDVEFYRTDGAICDPSPWLGQTLAPVHMQFLDSRNVVNDDCFQNGAALSVVVRVLPPTGLDPAAGIIAQANAVNVDGTLSDGGKAYEGFVIP